jgi:protocatechuate 3,4-dioxygenase beta subunit
VEEEWIAIGGRVLDAGSVPPGAPVAGAVVDVLDAGLRATTDELGHYRFERIPAGTRTVRAVAVGYQPSTRAFDVPGPAVTYDFNLTPNP